MKLDWQTTLHQRIWRHTLEDWLLAAGVFLATVLIAAGVKALLLYRLRKIAGQTQTRWDDRLVYLVEQNTFFLYLSLGLIASDLTISFRPKVELRLERAMVVFLMIQAGIWLQALSAGLVRRWSRRRASAAEQRTMAAATLFVTRMVIWTVILVSALGYVGVRVTGLLAGLGIGGVAAALAVQSLLGDLIASLSIYMDRPFDIGDFIICGDTIGTVDRIGLRTTRISSLWGQQTVVPNSQLTSSRIENYRRMRERRVHFHVGTTYDTPPHLVREVPERIREIIGAVPQARFDRAHLLRFGDSALEYEIAYYALSSDYGVYMDVQQAINFGIIDYFHERGIQFAFPTRTLHVQHDSPLRVRTAVGDESTGSL
ncbi:MAG: mechanosensitive ion channel family protein [Polyangiales bacterium]